MKKNKIVLLIIMTLVLTLTMVLPSFAMDYTQYATENCLYIWNFRGAYFQTCITRSQAVTWFNSNGDVLVMKAPQVRVRDFTPNANSNISFLPQGTDDYYHLYLNFDDNAQTITFKIYDPSSDSWHTYDTTYIDVYIYKTDTRLPLIYTDAISRLELNFYNMSPNQETTLPLFGSLRLSSKEAYIVPYNHKDMISISGNATQDQLNQAFEQGKAEGIEIGKQESVYQDRDTFIDLIQAIFTAPGYLINSIFDFELFGFNLANVIRAIITLALVAVAVFFIVKLII